MKLIEQLKGLPNQLHRSGVGVSLGRALQYSILLLMLPYYESNTTCKSN